MATHESLACIGYGRVSACVLVHRGEFRQLDITLLILDENGYCAATVILTALHRCMYIILNPQHVGITQPT